MFRRRKKEARAEGACTFCGFVPEVPVPTCPQCYYEFDKSPRDQGTRPAAADQADILALLEAEPTAMEEEATLVEAVLAMDDVTVDVPAFDAPSPVDDDQEVVGEHEFMESAGPTMSETKALYREDAYCQTATAKVLEVTEDGHLVLDQSIFYPMGGGQPGDKGVLTCAGKADVQVLDARNNREVYGQPACC